MAEIVASSAVPSLASLSHPAAADVNKDEAMEIDFDSKRAEKELEKLLAQTTVSVLLVAPADDNASGRGETAASVYSPAPLNPLPSLSSIATPRCSPPQFRSALPTADWR